MVTTIILVVVALILLGLLAYTQVDPAILVAVHLVPSAIGLAVLAVERTVSMSVVALNVASILALLLGRWMVRRRSGAPATKLKGVVQRSLADATVWTVVLVAGALSFYHLIATGIPIFSSGVERARFDFTSSGFFGVPGRMYLFGTMIAWILATVNSRAKGQQWRSDRPWLIASGILVVQAIASGFKGEFLSLVVTAVLVVSALASKKFRVHDVARKTWPLAVAGVAYFFAIAVILPTYSRSERSIIDLVMRRLTVGAAEPRALVLQGQVYGLEGNVLLGDLGYFSKKYFGQSREGDFTLERAVSAQMIGVNPASSSWTVPVTLGGFPELTLVTSAPVAILVFVLIGMWMGRREGNVSGDVVRSTLALVAVVAVYGWIMRGGIAYMLINWGAVVTLLALIAIPVELTARSRGHLACGGSPVSRPGEAILEIGSQRRGQA